jgi:hypothetical protein
LCFDCAPIEATQQLEDVPTMPLLTMADPGVLDASSAEQTVVLAVAGDLAEPDELPAGDTRLEPPEISRERLSRAKFVPVSEELLRRVLNGLKGKRWGA